MQRGQNAALDPAGIVAQAQAMVEQYGFKSIKLKGGAYEPQVEVDSILALREAFGPDMFPCDLIPTPSGKWTPPSPPVSSLKACWSTTKTRCADKQNMARVAQALDIPLATNMCTTSFRRSARQHRPSIGGDHPLRSSLLGRLPRFVRFGALLRCIRTRHVHALE